MIELQALNYVVQKKDADFFIMHSITDKYFRTYKNEFNFINDHIKKYGVTPDMTTVIAKFSDFPPTDTDETPEYLAGQLIQEFNAQLVVDTYKEVMTKFRGKDIAGGIQEATSIAHKIVENSAVHSVDIVKDKSRYDEYIRKSTDLGAYYVTTGFSEIDEILGGGWDRKEELATIVARPGVGKSWILLKCAIAAAQKGLRVGLYSGEMSELKVGYRFDTLLGNISNTDISHGIIGVQAEYKNFLDSLNDIVSGSLLILTPELNNKSPATVSDLQAFIERDSLDMLCVDQHSLIEDERKGRDSITKASNISRDLKNLQVLEKIPIIAVSQQNRDNKSDDETEKDLDVSRISQSDRIGQDSTVVLFLQHDHKNDLLTITMSKVRDAQTGKKLKYTVDLNKGIFKYIPVEDGEGGNKEECDQLREEYDGYNAANESTEPYLGEQIF